MDGAPVVFVKLISISQQSEDVVSSKTVSLEESVRDPCLFCPELYGRDKV